MTEDNNKYGPDATDMEDQDGASQAYGATEQSENDPIAALQAENNDLRDRFLRLAAEMDNLRRRTDRDVKDAKSYAVTSFARDMLAVSDNLRRALDTVPAEARAVADAGLTVLLEGVEMTERSMLSTLERHGIHRIDAVGQKFDPNFHQAMFEVPNPAVPNNTVIQVVQDGYRIGDRVLRPAMVGVAKGGQKAESAEPGTASVNEKDA